MNKKLMLLAAGVLSALAFAALPALASADEFAQDCEGAVECTGTIAGGVSELENSAGERIRCTGVNGSASFPSTVTTGSVSLNFTECREQVTFFKFKCNSEGAAAGEIKVGLFTYHIINLEHTPTTTPGIKITNINVTIECTGFAKKTVTGKVIGEIEEASSICNTFVNAHKINFAQSATTGKQKWIQTETTGTTTDLESNNHNGGPYLTSAQIGTGTITWDHNVKITC